MQTIYSVDVCCAGPEELEASRIPHEHLWRTVSLLWDKKERESQAYYFVGGGRDGPHILLVHDDMYRPEEEEEFFPQILRIIAGITEGRMDNESHTVELARNLSQQEIAAMARAYLAHSFFNAAVPLNQVNYVNVPEPIALNHGFPEEKVRVNPMDKPKHFFPLIRE